MSESTTCPKCQSRIQEQSERLTEYQCGSVDFGEGPRHETVACQTIAQLRQQLAEAQRKAVAWKRLAKANHRQHQALNEVFDNLSLGFVKQCQQLAECERERDALLNSVDKSRESWAGAKVIGCYPDGSYLIDNRGGARERVWFSADHEVLAEVRQQLAAVTRERDAETFRANMAEAKHDLARATLDHMVKITST